MFLFHKTLAIRSITHCGLLTPYDVRDLGQHWLGNGMLPDDINPLPELMLTELLTSILMQLHMKCAKYAGRNYDFKFNF